MDSDCARNPWLFRPCDLKNRHRQRHSDKQSVGHQLRQHMLLLFLSRHGSHLTAAPASGSTFAGWSGGGCSGTGTCKVTVNSAASVTAGFALKTHTVSVTKSITGGGTVTSSPTGLTAAVLAVRVIDGTPVTLTVTPNSGYTFTGWSGGGCSGTSTCQVSMSGTMNVIAYFTPKVALSLRSPAQARARSQARPQALAAAAHAPTLSLKARQSPSRPPLPPGLPSRDGAGEVAAGPARAR